MKSYVFFLWLINFCLFFISRFCFGAPSHVNSVEDASVPFEQHYATLWGEKNIFNQNMEVQLALDEHLGGSGFRSLKKYSSGWFSMKVKWPKKDSTGVITTFYLISDDGATRDEIDFEFLGGNNKERPYILHTNIFTNGQGFREQQFSLWFDPAADFHNYTFLWNTKQLMFFVDETPIRVFKNTTKKGGSYPTKGLSVTATIWNGSWASHGVPVNWNDAPFKAHYSGFGINACESGQKCDSSEFWWNGYNYWKLNSLQKQAYNNVRNKYLTYNYCTKNNTIPECQD